MPGVLYNEYAEAIARGDIKEGFSKLIDSFGAFNQIVPSFNPFSSILESVVQKNPELADRFSEKMLESQRSTEEFRVRHDLLNGPDDNPTIVGQTFRSLVSTCVSLIFGHITTTLLIP